MINYKPFYNDFRTKYEAGQNCYQIAAEYGTCQETVRRGIRKAGGKTSRRQRKYFTNPAKERRINFFYGLFIQDIDMMAKKQKMMCLWCRAPLPKDLLTCVIDHIGGRETFGQRDKVRGLCCANGHCNRLAGMVETGLLTYNSLFMQFIRRVRNVLRMNKGIL